MKLTIKDKEFLERLRALMEEKELWVDLKADGIKRMVLRGNYGSRIETLFGMTRQGVRWRFQRLFNDIYVSTYETIFVVEKSFGAGLRHYAMDIARERWELRQRLKAGGRH